MAAGSSSIIYDPTKDMPKISCEGKDEMDFESTMEGPETNCNHMSNLSNLARSNGLHPDPVNIIHKKLHSLKCDLGSYGISKNMEILNPRIGNCDYQYLPKK